MFIFLYQSCVLGKFSVEPLPDTIKELMNVVNNAMGLAFVPSVFAIREIDPTKNRVTSISRLKLVTNDQRWDEHLGWLPLTHRW